MGRLRNPVKFTVTDPVNDEVRKRLLRELVGIQMVCTEDRAWDFYATLIDQLKKALPDGQAYMNQIMDQATRIKPAIPVLKFMMKGMIDGLKKIESNEKEI